MSQTIVVRIEDRSGSAPLIEVLNEPFGYNIHVGPLVNNPEVEHGALVNLLGVDATGEVPEQGWRFVDPALPAGAARNALHIIWLTHDHSGPFGNGDLQIGYNTVLPGHHYANPTHTRDKDLGPAPDQWTTVHADERLVIQFRREQPAREKANGGVLKTAEFSS